MFSFSFSFLAFSSLNFSICACFSLHLFCLWFTEFLESATSYVSPNLGTLFFSKIFSVSISPLPLDFNDTDIKTSVIILWLGCFCSFLRKHLLSLFFRLDIFLLKFIDSLLGHPLHNLSWTYSFISVDMCARNFYKETTFIIYSLSFYSLVGLSIRVELEVWVEEVGRPQRRNFPKDAQPQWPWP